MEVIQSFTIDHTRLKPGIYVSREDKGFTTFDLRITEPNKEPAVAPILTQTEVPATTPETCGNCLLHDLPMCLWESRRYLDRLRNDFHSEYTKLQVTLADGRQFADA